MVVVQQTREQYSLTLPVGLRLLHAVDLPAADAMNQRHVADRPAVVHEPARAVRLAVQQLDELRHGHDGRVSPEAVLALAGLVRLEARGDDDRAGVDDRRPVLAARAERPGDGDLEIAHRPGKRPSLPSRSSTCTRGLRRSRPASDSTSSPAGLSLSKTLARSLHRPPSRSDFSTSTTSMPRPARSAAAFMPATPPPMTSARRRLAMRIGSSALERESLPTAAAIRRIALSVAPARVVLVGPTALLANVHVLVEVRVEPGPADGVAEGQLVQERRARRHHHAVEFLARARRTGSMSWPGSEHMNVWTRATATPGSLPASAATRSTSITSEMFPPHLQTYTPTRSGSSESLSSSPGSGRLV